MRIIYEVSKNKEALTSIKPIQGWFSKRQGY
jgi:hypothetical protein